MIIYKIKKYETNFITRYGCNIINNLEYIFLENAELFFQGFSYQLLIRDKIDLLILKTQNKMLKL